MNGGTCSTTTDILPLSYYLAIWQSPVQSDLSLELVSLEKAPEAIDG